MLAVKSEYPRPAGGGVRRVIDLGARVVEEGVVRPFEDREVDSLAGRLQVSLELACRRGRDVVVPSQAKKPSTGAWSAARLGFTFG